MQCVFWIQGYKVTGRLSVFSNKCNGIKFEWDKTPKRIGGKFATEYRKRRNMMIKGLLNSLWKDTGVDQSVLILDDFNKQIVATMVYSGNLDTTESVMRPGTFADFSDMALLGQPA